MGIDTFSFGNTHSWSDHARVKDAVETMNKLPAYSSGAIRLGNYFSVGQIETYLAQEERYIASQKQRIESDRCAGFNADTIGRDRDYLEGLEKYAAALRTIRDYMKSYAPCGCDGR